MLSSVTFNEISAADFFYRNKDIAGFSNPARAIYSAVRELVENSLDACELHGFLPELNIRITSEDSSESAAGVHTVRVHDNGSGIPARHIPSAFAQVFYGSKYRLRQSRGTFGLGGTMAILYGQITAHKPVKVTSSTGTSAIHEYELMIDIQRNRPIVHRHKASENENGWHGVIIEVKMEGDYGRAAPKVLEYFRQTSMVVPYANITFIDPRGRLYWFERATTTMPSPPTETQPHPHGSDVEAVKRMVQQSNCRGLKDFLTHNFQKIGPTTALKFIEYAGIPEQRKPRNLSNDEIVKLVHAMKEFPDFRAPGSNCLSPLGEGLLRTGVNKELRPEFLAVKIRNASVYSGFPFIVEAAVAYGGDVQKTGDITLYRFANRIPLLYDEASDVSWKVIHEEINWKHYGIDPLVAPVAVVTHICSTKIPYRSVGKEFIADEPEVERELLNGVREAARELASYLSRKHAIETEKRRLDVFDKFLPHIANFSAELAGRSNPPDVKPLLKSVMTYGPEEDKTYDEEQEARSTGSAA